MPASHLPRLLYKVGFVEPMQCLSVDALPEGPEWVYEFKLDGYRALGLKIGGRIRFLSRNAKDLSARIADITAALTGLPDQTVVDCEIVAIDHDGRPSFNDLQNHQSSGASVFYYLFDLLTCRGKDLRGWPFKERRAGIIALDHKCDRRTSA